jgi:hypothetical protein
MLMTIIEVICMPQAIKYGSRQIIHKVCCTKHITESEITISIYDICANFEMTNLTIGEMKGDPVQQLGHHKT